MQQLLGSPITLPGTPEHYKDVTTRILNEQACRAQIANVQLRPSTHKEPYLGAMMHQLQQQYLQANILSLTKTYGKNGTS